MKRTLMLKKLLLLILILPLFFLQPLTAKEYTWSHKLTFLGLLKRYHIPASTYYKMDTKDKELIQEIRAGQSYSVIKKKGKVKVKSSLKPICIHCKLVKRRGVLRRICTNPKHKGKQG